MLAVAGISFLPYAGALARGKSAPVIAIIGGGLAGLTCAYRLRQGGLDATVYEAAPRLGGRCYTLRNFFDENQTIERGGELIDSDHVHIRRLARELELDARRFACSRGPGKR